MSRYEIRTKGAVDCIIVDTESEPASEVEQLRAERDEAIRGRDEALAEAKRLSKRLNTPELHDFAAAVVLEAAHQRERWGTEHDGGKEPADWFWLLGYLAGKALKSALTGDTDKALHHTVSSAAALANWHAQLLGASNEMRPGIMPPGEEVSGG